MGRAELAWIVLLGPALAAGLTGCGSGQSDDGPHDVGVKVTLADGRTGVRTASGNVRLDSGEVVDESGALVPDENPATVEQLCTAMEAEECSQAWPYDQCVEWFGSSENGMQCAGEVYLLLDCVDMDVRFECDYNGVPFPRGVVEDPEAAVLNEYCEEEWFKALDCVAQEHAEN